MNRKYQDPIETLSDAVSYDTLQKNNPALLQAIQALLGQGVKAKNLERWARKNYGQDNLTALLVAGAAHHAEKSKKS